MVFSAKDKESVERAVRAAEAITSGEIVPVVVASSGNYSHIGHWLGNFGLLVGAGVTLLLHQRYPFLEFHFLLGIVFLAWLVFWQLGQFPIVIRLFAGESRLAEDVHNAALAAFTRYGLHHTKGETGVLVYISLLEHQVEILADRGIHEKAGEGYWRREVDKIVAGIRERKAGDALAEVVRDIGEKLSESFPREEQDRNEISDELRSR